MKATENKPLDAWELLQIIDYELGFTAPDEPGTLEQDWIDYLEKLRKITVDYIDTRP